MFGVISGGAFIVVNSLCFGIFLVELCQVWQSYQSPEQKHLIKHRCIILCCCILVFPMSACGYMDIVNQVSEIGFNTISRLFYLFQVLILHLLFYSYWHFGQTIGITYYRIQHKNDILIPKKWNQCWQAVTIIILELYALLLIVYYCAVQTMFLLWSFFVIFDIFLIISQAACFFMMQTLGRPLKIHLQTVSQKHKEKQTRSQHENQNKTARLQSILPSSGHIFSQKNNKNNNKATKTIDDGQSAPGQMENKQQVHTCDNSVEIIFHDKQQPHEQHVMSLSKGIDHICITDKQQVDGKEAHESHTVACHLRADSIKLNSKRLSKTMDNKTDWNRIRLMKREVAQFNVISFVNCIAICIGVLSIIDLLGFEMLGVIDYTIIMSDVSYLTQFGIIFCILIECIIYLWYFNDNSGTSFHLSAKLAYDYKKSQTSNGPNELTCQWLQHRVCNNSNDHGKYYKSPTEEKTFGNLPNTTNGSKANSDKDSKPTEDQPKTCTHNQIEELKFRSGDTLTVNGVDRNHLYGFDAYSVNSLNTSFDSAGIDAQSKKIIPEKPTGKYGRKKVPRTLMSDESKQEALDYYFENSDIFNAPAYEIDLKLESMPSGFSTSTNKNSKSSNSKLRNYPSITSLILSARGSGGSIVSGRGGGVSPTLTVLSGIAEVEDDQCDSTSDCSSHASGPIGVKRILSAPIGDGDGERPYVMQQQSDRQSTPGPPESTKKLTSSSKSNNRIFRKKKSLKRRRAGNMKRGDADSSYSDYDTGSEKNINVNDSIKRAKMSMIVYEFDNVFGTLESKIDLLQSEFEQFENDPEWQGFRDLETNRLKLLLGGKERVESLKQHLNNVAHEVSDDCKFFIFSNKRTTIFVSLLLEKIGLLEPWFLSKFVLSDGNIAHLPHVFGKEHAKMIQHEHKSHLLVLNLMHVFDKQHDCVLYVGNDKNSIENIQQIDACHVYQVKTNGMLPKDIKRIENKLQI